MLGVGKKMNSLSRLSLLNAFFVPSQDIRGKIILNVPEFPSATSRMQSACRSALWDIAKV